jgi:predicted enzyme related to lactoylglutathione lyase
LPPTTRRGAAARQAGVHHADAAQEQHDLAARQGSGDELHTIGAWCWLPGMVKFYRDVLGLKLKKDEKGWKEFDANGCVIALHNGTSQVGRRPPKIGFWAKDIAAARQELVGRGARMSKVMVGGGLVRCEGTDPDGNPFSISDRV